MDIQRLISEARDTLNVARVFGEPYEKGGVTVIPVAAVQGGGGGGEGTQGEAERGSGGGFGLSVRPAGMFVIRDDEVSWEPALDLTKIIVGGQIVLAIALLTLRSIVKSRRKAL